MAPFRSKREKREKAKGILSYTGERENQVPSGFNFPSGNADTQKAVSDQGKALPGRGASFR
jgi:hypothetical protein